jgi:GH24 family phage-related lysozyme (muramidase)
MMTYAQWEAEVARRIGIDEGYRTTMYHDSVGIPTIGIGFNLNRSDAPSIIKSIGADYGAVMSGLPLSDAQVQKLFAISFAPIIAAARASLDESHFDAMSDARRFVLCDLEYNLGAQGWLDFPTTRAVINQACHFDAYDDHAAAHAAFGQAADHLQNSAWFGQVGDRAARNVAMLRSSDWVDANGNGST